MKFDIKIDQTTYSSDNLECLSKSELENLSEKIRILLMKITKLISKRKTESGKNKTKDRKLLKTLVIGSENINKYYLIRDAILSSLFDISMIICSNDKNTVDLLIEKFARKNEIPLKKVDLKNFNIFDVDALIAIWDGKSKEVKNIIDKLKEEKKKVVTMEPLV